MVCHTETEAGIWAQKAFVKVWFYSGSDKTQRRRTEIDLRAIKHAAIIFSYFYLHVIVWIFVKVHPV